METIFKKERLTGLVMAQHGLGCLNVERLFFVDREGRTEGCLGGSVGPKKRGDS